MEVRIIWDVYRKSLTFGGRASRKEYWIFHLYITVLYSGFLALDILYFDYDFGSFPTPALFFISSINFLTLLAVTVRRFHDVGLSGWYLLIWLIPYLGLILPFMILASGGTQGDNEYGPEPEPALRA